MSKSIVIQESGTDKSLEDISYVVTQKYGSGTVAWMPEDEANRKEITIKKNGTVTAKSKNCYGFSKVKVNVKGGVSGKKPQSSGGDGNTHYYDTDDDGNLIDTVLPDSINITTNPTKTEYNEGQFINPAGMVVKAYKGDGTIWNGAGYTDGVIPNGELEISPITAQASAGDEYTDGNGVVAKAFSIIETEAHSGYTTYTYFKSGDVGVQIESSTTPPNKIYATVYGDYVYFAADITDNNMYITTYKTGKSATHVAVKTAFWQVGKSDFENYYGAFLNSLPESTSNPNNKNISTLSPSSRSVITVSWDRPEDGETLSDTFNITVT